MSLSLLQIWSKSVLTYFNLEKSLEIGSSPIYSDRSVHGRQKKKVTVGPGTETTLTFPRMYAAARGACLKASQLQACLLASCPGVRHACWQTAHLMPVMTISCEAKMEPCQLKDTSRGLQASAFREARGVKEKGGSTFVFEVVFYSR